MSKRDAFEVPDETLPRIKILVERSAPNPERPRLPEDIELQLQEIETKSAACYADNENRVARLRKLSREINAKRVTKAQK
jgi:hypothetical protein